MFDAGAAAAILEYSRDRSGQPDTLIDLPKQQYATIGSDVATLKIDDDFSAPKASQCDFVAGTLWQRLST